LNSSQKGMGKEEEAASAAGRDCTEIGFAVPSKALPWLFLNHTTSIYTSSGHPFAKNNIGRLCAIWRPICAHAQLQEANMRERNESVSHIYAGTKLRM